MTESPEAPRPPDPPAGSDHPTVAIPTVPEVLDVEVSGPRTDGTAVLALVLAAVSWVTLPVLLAIVALVLARSAERAISSDPERVGGGGLVTVTRWLAWVQLLVVAMATLFVGGFLLAIRLGS